MKILHSYCLNYNIGDYALGIGVKNLLRNYLNVDFIGETNIQGRNFDEYYINEVVNKKYDLLVIGGGGIIHGAHWPNGWFWLIDQNLIKQIKIPFIVYGIGNNYFGNELIPRKAVLHLQETFKNALYFSVRNDGSFYRVVDQIGVKPFVVPDPGFHVGLNTDFDRVISKSYVIVQLANDKSDQRFENVEKKNEFVTAMRLIVSELAQSYFVLFTPHVFDDIEISKQISAGIENTGIWEFSFYAFDHIPQAVSYYKYAEFVLAMRGHGQIIPIGFNVPVISLSNHPKHAGLMKELDLLDYNVSINEKNFEIEVLERVKMIVENYDLLKNKLKSINKGLIDSSKAAFDEIKLRLNL